MPLTTDLKAARRASASLAEGIRGTPGFGEVSVATWSNRPGLYGVRVEVDGVAAIRSLPPAWQGIDIDFDLGD